MQKCYYTLALLLLLLATAVPRPSDADSILKPRTSHRTAPTLVLLDLAGRRHSLEDYRGKVVLVNFFGTWCSPCLQEMPSLLTLAEAFRDQPFEVLAVNVGDPPETLRRMFAEEKEAFTVLLDSRQSAAIGWNALAFPTSFLLDAEGQIRYSVEGPVEWDDPDVAKQVVALFPKKGSP